MSSNRFTRLAIAACLALAVFLPRPADAGGFNPAIGNYLNPDSVGWGLDVQRIGDFIFVLWFTYRPDGSPIWYLSAAELDGMSWSASIDEYHWSAAKTATPTSVGTMSLVWSDAENATFSWTLDGVSGELPVAFLAFDTGLTTVNHTGHYVAPEEPGWGASILSQGGTSAMFLYFYDANGNPVWLLGVDGTPGMQQAFELNYFEGPGLCPSCIAEKKPGSVVAKVSTQVAVEVRFASIKENLFDDIGADFTMTQTLGALNAVPGTVNPNTPLGNDPLGAVDIPTDGGIPFLGPFQTINMLTPSPNVLLLPEMIFFQQRTKAALVNDIFGIPATCDGNLSMHIEIPAQETAGYAVAEAGGQPLIFSLSGALTAPAQVGVAKAGDETIVVTLQADFADGTREGLNLVTTIPNPGGTIASLDSHEVTRASSIPFLSDIPILGFLFTRKVDTAVSSGLMVMVCARITEVSEGR